MELEKHQTTVMLSEEKFRDTYYLLDCSSSWESERNSCFVKNMVLSVNDIEHVKKGTDQGFDITGTERSREGNIIKQKQYIAGNNGRHISRVLHKDTVVATEKCISSSENLYGAHSDEIMFSHYKHCKKNSKFNEHDITFLEDKYFPRNICEKKFTQIYHLAHKFTHSADNSLTCGICDKRFASSSSLKAHHYIHSGDKPFICKICDRKFTQGSNLKTHQLIHTGSKQFTCSICDKRFAHRSALKRHHLIHTGDKPYTCNTCEKRFIQMCDLKAHQWNHTGKKPFVCDSCDKSFVKRCDLRRHHIIHTGDKPFTCSTCDKRFTQKSSLKTHQVTHTGDKLFVCDVCNKGFTSNRYFKIHRLSHS